MTGYFDAAYFDAQYFESADDLPPVPSGYGRPRSQPIPPGWPIDLDDEELMFWIL